MDRPRACPLPPASPQYPHTEDAPLFPVIQQIAEGRSSRLRAKAAPAARESKALGPLTKPRLDAELPRPFDLVTRARRAGRAMIPEAQTAAVVDRLSGEVLRAPIVERRTFAEPDDVGRLDETGVPVAPRQVSGYHRASTLRQLRAGGTQISERSLIAADLYEGDFEAAQRGGFPKGPPPEIRGSAGPGDYTSLVYYGRRFDAATKFVGRFGSHLLNHVLFDRRDVGSWAATQFIEGRPLDRKAAMGVLIAVLDRLAEHYEGRVDEVLQSARRKAAAERADARARDRR